MSAQPIAGLVTILRKSTATRPRLNKSVRIIERDPCKDLRSRYSVYNDESKQMNEKLKRSDSSKVSSKSAKKPSTKDGGSTAASAAKKRSSFIQEMDMSQIPDVPVILFMGGPGGGKTRHAARVQETLGKLGLVHICMPDMIRAAISKYQYDHPEWKVAAQNYQKGELIPNDLAFSLVKTEMCKHPNAKAFFLEGFPREAKQIEDFESEVRPVNMAMILDYDEATLRNHMENRGLNAEVIDARINEFKVKTLPSAKYFDDQKLLHLIPGEEDDQWIFERMTKLIKCALEMGIPVTTSKVASRVNSPKPVASANTTRTSIKSTASGGRSSNVTSAKGETSQRGVSEKKNSIEALVNQSETTAVGKAQQRQSTSGAQKSTSTSEQVARRATVQDNSMASTVGSDQVIGTKAIRTQSGIIETKATVHQGPTSAPTAKIGSTSNSSERAESSKEAVPNSAKQTSGIGPGRTSNASTPSPAVPITGPPGSFKAKLSQRIAAKYDGFIYLSMGKLLRQQVSENSNDELWQRIQKKMDAGNVVPMKICRDLLYTEIFDKCDKSWGFVIEGYPRSKAQSVDFQNQVQRIDLVILIDCTEQFCIDTLKRRWEEMKRPEDSDDVARSRLNSFKQNTLPMLKSFDDLGIMKVVRMKAKVDGDADIDKIFEESVNAINDKIFIEDRGDGKSLSSSKNASVDDGI